jgi:hypothetical protein
MGSLMSELEKLALIVASMCHDLDHRGTNNSFQTKYSISQIHLFSNFVLCRISVYVIRLCSHLLEGN